MFNNISNILKPFEVKVNSYDRKVKKLRREAEVLEAEFNRKQDQLLGLTCPSWIDLVIKPIAKELAEKTFRDWTVSDEAGLCNEVTISLYTKGILELRETNPSLFLKALNSKNKIIVERITFVPMNIERTDIRIVDYSKSTFEFKKHTIGSMNGMNYKRIKMPKTIAGILKIMNLKEIKN
jgi:hypothetical protein